VDDQVKEIISRLQSRGVEIITNPRPAPWRPGTTIAEFATVKEIAWSSAAGAHAQEVNAHEKPF
jgi:hypothetical protein